MITFRCVSAALVAVALAFVCGSSWRAAAEEIAPQLGSGASGEKPFLLGTKAYPIPKLELPKRGVTFLDPNFGTKITRVTDPSDGWGRGMRRHAYSPFSPLNADLSLIAEVGGAEWHLYDSKTCKMLRTAPGPWHDVRALRWDTYDPNVYYFVEKTALKKYDLKANEMSVVRDFKKDFPKMTWLFLPAYGDPSFDSRMWGFSIMGDNTGSRGLVIEDIVYDKKEDKIVGRLPINKRGAFPACVSPSGKLVVLKDTCYDVSFKNPRKIPPGRGHSDMGVDVNGRDVVVYKGDKTDYVMKCDLLTGKATKLIHVIHGADWRDLLKFGGPYGGQGTHISGNCYATPGWAVISRYGVRGKKDLWSSHAVYLVKLEDNPDLKNPKPYRVADGHSVWDPAKGKHYWAETHASIDYSGSQIFFASNWDDVKAEIEDYRVELPEGWYEKLMGEEEAREAREKTAKNFGVTVEKLLRRKP